MGYNKVFLVNQPLNVSSVSIPLQVGQAGFIDACYALQAAFSGSTCNFKAKLQVSSDAYNNNPNYVPTHWDDLVNSEITFTSSGTFTWDVNQVGYVWVRLVMTDLSSGTNNGNISATINVNP